MVGGWIFIDLVVYIEVSLFVIFCGVCCQILFEFVFDVCVVCINVQGEVISGLVCDFLLYGFWLVQEEEEFGVGG